jgi:hypothetical protein
MPGAVLLLAMRLMVLLVVLLLRCCGMPEREREEELLYLLCSSRKELTACWRASAFSLGICGVAKARCLLSADLWAAVG